MYGSRCENCGGEDCVCCEVYREYEADCRTEALDYGDIEDSYYLNLRECDNCGEEAIIMEQTRIDGSNMWLCEDCIVQLGGTK